MNRSVSLRRELTGRELHMLRSLADGRTDHQIAASLVLSHRTVSHHVERITAKLAAKNRTHAVVIAMRLNLIAFD